MLTSNTPPSEIVSQHINRKDVIPVSTQADLLGISRSAVYYRPLPADPQDLVIMDRIDVIYTDMPYYGVRRMTAQLKRDGYGVGKKLVRRLMREMGLEPIYPKPNLSKNHTQNPRYPYLLRGLDITRPNQVWGTDITYIKMRQGFVYLVVFLDWYSRYVVSWRISTSLDTRFVIEAAEEALKLATPEIANSDQGVQFTSGDYLSIWNPDTTQISMDGRGRCMDNIFTERLWRSVKYDDIYPNQYDCVIDVRDGLTKYFNIYNHRRLHQSLNYQTPAEVYFAKKGELDLKSAEILS